MAKSLVDSVLDEKDKAAGAVSNAVSTAKRYLRKGKNVAENLTGYREVGKIRGFLRDAAKNAGK